MSEKTFIDKLGSIMDKNIRGVQYTIYGLAGLGLFIAFRSTRPFQKFHSSTDIPRHFINKKIRLNGKVVSIRPGQNPVLLIDHYPLVPLPLRTQGQLLPVQISSIDVNSNGLIWMDTLLKGTEVNFVPLKINNKLEVVESVLYKSNQDVGQHLVKIGFALPGGFDIDLNDDLTYKKYYKNVLSSERIAESNRAGVWSDQKPTLWQRFFLYLSRLTFLRKSLPV